MPNPTHRFLPAAIAALTFAAACAPKAPPAETAPAPSAPAAPTIMTSCPGAADGPSIVVNAVEEANRALAMNPSTPLPPACLLSAYGQVSSVLPDSIDAHALKLDAELRRRGGANERDLLTGEVVLFSRAHRYAEASRAYDRLTALDPEPPMSVARLALAAARARGDTAALVRLLSRMMTRADASPALRSEQNVLRQVSALHGAINEARGLIRQNPKYVAAYPSLVGNFGTLGAADSVVAYIRRGLGQGASRASLAPALDPFVNTMLRDAAIFGGANGWKSQIAAAARVDSVLSTASTKFLVAALVAQSAETEIAEIGALVNGRSWLPSASGAEAARARTEGCARIPALSALLDTADKRLHDGGDRYTGGGVPQISSSIANEKDRLSAFSAICGGSSGAQ